MFRALKDSMVQDQLVLLDASSWKSPTGSYKEFVNLIRTTTTTSGLSDQEISHLAEASLDAVARAAEARLLNLPVGFYCYVSRNRALTELYHAFKSPTKDQALAVWWKEQDEMSSFEFQRRSVAGALQTLRSRLREMEEKHNRRARVHSELLKKLPETQETLTKLDKELDALEFEMIDLHAEIHLKKLTLEGLGYHGEGTWQEDGIEVEVLQQSYPSGFHESYTKYEMVSIPRVE